jgi:uncharacterized protein (DUF1684 family)
MRSIDAFELLDWKRRIFDLYAQIRARELPARSWELWRWWRDDMFKNHPQSPIPREQRAAFTGLDLFDYDPTYRVIGKVRDEPEQSYEIPTSGDVTMRFTRFGVTEFSLGGENLELELYWLDAYGGGLFLPFRDATSGSETYGAGRYLYDTVKGADLGTDLVGLDDSSRSAGRTVQTSGSTIVLDFNFAYNPSCAYDPRWVCPLAPPPNRLEVPVRAGEKIPAGPTG